MADLTFNTASGATIDRELLIAYLNTSSTSTPTWSPLGKRVTDSSVDVDWGEETNRDILGETYTTFRKPTMTQSFEPFDLDGGDAAALKLWNMAFKDHNYSGLANLDMLIVHFYAGTASTPFAERYSSCAISPSSLGGEGGGHISMPISVTYGGTRTVGTASKDSTTGAITFSAAS